jgi:hypothetical protein
MEFPRDRSTEIWDGSPLEPLRTGELSEALRWQGEYRGATGIPYSTRSE